MEGLDGERAQSFLYLIILYLTLPSLRLDGSAFNDTGHRAWSKGQGAQSTGNGE